MKNYDAIIIGAGPAGLSAGIYLARRKHSVLIISKNIGGQAVESWQVKNYLGFSVLTGQELVDKFKEHIKDYDIELSEGDEVVKVAKTDRHFTIKTGNDELRAKAVIIASGKKPLALEVPGEKEYRNKGVTYCATCDGPVFTDKKVAVVGGGNAALETALQMEKISPEVTIIDIAEKLSGNAVLQEKVAQSDKIKVISSASVKEIKGADFVNGLTYIDTDDKEYELALEGVIIEIGTGPVTSFIKDLVELNDKGEIKTDKRCETSTPGIFAAGDVTDVPEKQIIIAAGEGAKAALAASDYLARIRN